MADAADRLPEPYPFPGELVEPARQLARHAVELRPERRELVVAFDPDRRGEVAAPEPPRGLEKTAQPALECARGKQRESERERQEGDDQDCGDGAATPSEVAVADSADRTVTVTRAPPKPANVWLAAR